MEKVRLGRTGLMVSRIGFGGIPIQRASEDDAVATVRRCLDLGINFIDTANAYTTSEARIGKAISGRREDLVLATKTGLRDSKGVKEHLKLSLEHLGVESIDLYQLHQVGDSKNMDMVLAPNGTVEVLEEAKAAGKIKHIGVSSHSLDTALELVKTGRFETIQFPFNFITNEAAEKLLPLAKEHDVGFIGMKPLAGGMLDNVTVAFKYLMQFPYVVPIPGVEEIREIEEIVGIIEGPREMTDAELREMQRLRDELGNFVKCSVCGTSWAPGSAAAVITASPAARASLYRQS